MLDLLGINNYSFSFPEIASPTFAGIIDLHHEIMFFLVIIVIFVSWLLLNIIFLFNEKDNRMDLPSYKVSHHVVLEVIWTIIPGVVLLLISVPSFALLYSIDEVINPVLTLKIVGHQWYWTYEVSDYATSWLSEIAPLFDQNHEELTMNMIIEEDLIPGTYRLLETNNHVLLPIKTHIRALVTSTDVLHSWAVPSLGVKLDACPGRLNQTALYIDKLGIYYGQCSEICGYAHGFMPIVIEGTLLELYFLWTWIYFWGKVFIIDNILDV